MTNLPLTLSALPNKPPIQTCPVSLGFDGSEMSYCLRSPCNQFEKYKNLSKSEKNVIFGGRLAEYKYYDMHQVIGSAMSKAKRVLGEK